MKVRFHIDYVDAELPRKVIEEYLIDDSGMEANKVIHASEEQLIDFLQDDERTLQSLYDDYVDIEYRQVQKVELLPND